MSREECHDSFDAKESQEWELLRICTQFTVGTSGSEPYSQGNTKWKEIIGRKVPNLEFRHDIHLTELQSRGKLLGFLQSVKSRKSLDSLNTSLCVLVSELESFYFANKKESYSTISIFRLPGETDEIHAIRESCEPVWDSTFGEENFVVAWDLFISKLCYGITSQEENIIREIADPSNTNSVNRYKFSEILRGFGPVNACIQNMLTVGKQPYFHGYMSADESYKYLDFCDFGTFLVRFSSSRPGEFSVDFVGNSAAQFEKNEEDFDENSEKTRYRLIPVENGQKKIFSVGVISSDGSYRISDEISTRNFRNFPDLIKFYDHLFIEPFVDTLEKFPWFYGVLDPEESDRLLEGSPAGTFLVRFSSQPSCYTASYVDSTENIQKVLICKSSSGYFIDRTKDPRNFKKLDGLIEAYGKVGLFKTPLRSSSEISTKILGNSGEISGNIPEPKTPESARRLNLKSPAEISKALAKNVKPEIPPKIPIARTRARTTEPAKKTSDFTEISTKNPATFHEIPRKSMEKNQEKKSREKSRENSGKKSGKFRGKFAENVES
eukprot:TRINITY_DN7557_c0_g1_i2.p1 TRINITY_DN7557_c0_g1~~TRINITY_DN7557_c0_g1_i2.p1  ORF type:complete len:551 (-),score=92.56 TRINITY_DN7557_c0_g1_i2:371-2023(-)